MSPDPWIDDQRLEIGGARFIASAVALGDTDGASSSPKSPDGFRLSDHWTDFFGYLA